VGAVQSRTSNERRTKQFENELEVFRKEAEAASQFFYGYLAIHEVAKHNRAVLRFLNTNALLWNTVAGALQMSALIALHRVFIGVTIHMIPCCDLLKTM